MGFSALAIGNRVGHETEKITYRYAHLFPTVQNEMAEKLEIERMSKEPELIEDDVFRITIPLDKVAAAEGREQKTLSEREQKIYNMICENLHLSVEQVMAELDISRATVFRDYAKIKKVTGAMYDKKTSTWTLD